MSENDQENGNSEKIEEPKVEKPEVEEEEKTKIKIEEPKVEKPEEEKETKTKFTFKCTRCDECCLARGPIPITFWDLELWAKNGVVANFMPYLDIYQKPDGGVDLVLKPLPPTPKEGEEETQKGPFGTVPIEELLDVKCPLYNKDDKKCLIYDNRPLSCRTYPLEFDGKNFIVVDADCPGIGESGMSKEELVKMRPELGEIPDNGIAHRLDNNTSGIVCAGKTLKSYESLRTQFANNAVSKHYTALVLGGAPEHEEIDAPIAHHRRKKTKMVVCESEARADELKARAAHTHYDVAGRYLFGDESYTLLDIVISAGVRHQIRAHLAWKGLPLAGDKLYQNPKKRAEDLLPLKRHFLHASKLEIDHPLTSERMIFECPLPSDLKEALEQAEPV